MRKTVYKVTPSPGFAAWSLASGLGFDPERSNDGDWASAVLTRDSSDAPDADFAAIRGLPGYLLVPAPENMKMGQEWMTTYNGELFTAGGDAEGFMIFRPTVLNVLDEEQSLGLDQDEVQHYAFRANRLHGELFRVLPRLGDIFVLHNELTAGLVTDLDDYVNMDFMTWWSIAGATGLDFETVWTGAAPWPKI